MNTIETDLLNTLLELDRQVKAMAGAQSKPNLLPLFQRLDDLAAQLPPDAAPDLIHYLRRKSYEKARLFLEGRAAEAPRGTCGH